MPMLSNFVVRTVLLPLFVLVSIQFNLALNLQAQGVTTKPTRSLPARSQTPNSVNGPVEPYVVYVARHGEHTRCGPANDYYKADPIAAGQPVEVYLETEDGWLGIRPPDNSFCWLQSDQVEVADDQSTGTIIEGAAVAWIGTHLGKARQYRWQVRLQEGEEVTIIGTAKRDGPEGDEVWYRIVPPAGEFRWLHRSQVVESSEQVDFQPTSRSQSSDVPNLQPIPSVAAKLAPPQPPADNSDELMDEGRSAPRSDDLVESQSADSFGGTVGSGLRPSRTDDQQSWITREDAPLEAREGIRQVAATEPDPKSFPVAQSDYAAVTTAPSSYVPSIEFESADIQSLSAELSKAMVASATVHETTAMRKRTADLANHSTDRVTRDRASILLRRIEEYQRIARHREKSSNAIQPSESSLDPASLTGSEQLQVANLATPTQPAIIAQNVAVDAATGEKTQFDRQGWLVKVYSARAGAPPYAITDSAGRTLSYVTPVPGVNLRRYLNQEVGLYGRVAFDTSLETPHLIAEQAVRVRPK